MDNKKKWYEAKWVHYTIAACSAVLLFVILNNLGTEWAAVKKFIGFFSPVLFGAIIAYIVDPLAVFFEKRLFGKMKKGTGRYSGHPDCCSFPCIHSCAAHSAAGIKSFYVYQEF